MASRRVLVFDNDIAFLTLLKSSLGAYGFEVQVADPRSNDIHRVKALKPNAIFIAVDSPDKFGYTLYTKVRKAVGNKIPIILATTTISPRDFALHGKTKMRADVYLDKKSLSRKKLLHKLHELIGLESRTGPLPPEDNEDVSGRLGGSSAEVNEDADTINLEELADDELAPIFEFLDETIESEGNANLAVPVQTDVMDDQTVKKDLEITRLTKKLHDSNRKILSDNKRLKEFAKEVNWLKREIGKGQKREKELAALVQTRHNEINRAQESLNALEQKLTEEQQQAHQHFEAKIAKLQGAVSKAEKKSLTQLHATEEKHKHDLQALKMKYASEIAQLQNETKSEIEALKHRSTEEAQLVSDMLTKERQAHKKTRQHFEAKIAKLQNQHAAAIKQAELEKQHVAQLRDEEEKPETDLLKAEEKLEVDLEAPEEKKSAKQILQPQKEKKAEIEEEEPPDEWLEI